MQMSHESVMWGHIWPSDLATLAIKNIQRDIVRVCTTNEISVSQAEPSHLPPGLSFLYAYIVFLIGSPYQKSWRCCACTHIEKGQSERLKLRGSPITINEERKRDEPSGQSAAFNLMHAKTSTVPALENWIFDDRKGRGKKKTNTGQKQRKRVVGRFRIHLYEG